MRLMRHLAATIVSSLASSLAIAACGDQYDEGVLVTIRTTHPEIVQGEVAQVVVTVLNTGERPFTMEGNTCNGHFRVRDASGAVVGPTSGACTAISIPVTLGPSESRDFPGYWNARMPPKDGADTSPTYVPAGSYRVRGSMRLPPERKEESSVNEVTIRLRAP